MDGKINWDFFFWMLMITHFRGQVPLPLIGNSVGYAFIIIPLYILVRVLVAKAVNWMSRFRNENPEA